MRIVSWNVNGIRAWLKKDGLAWLERNAPDVFCIQEAKALEDQVAKKDREALAGLGYKAYWHPADRKGYSGVVTFSRTPAMFVTRGVPFERGEGRVIITEHGEFTLYNIYFPNGRQREDGPDPERLAFKLEFYETLLDHLEEERAEGKNLVIAGDWNTALTEIDLARPKENEGTTGFLPVEREALQAFVDRGYIDTFRHLHPAEAFEGIAATERPYTWWTYRAGARDRNVGWRIDYQFVNEEFSPAVKAAEIWSDDTGSDHCPILLDLDC